MSAIPKIDEAKLDSVSGTPPAIYHVTKLEKCKLDQAGPSGYRYVIEGGYAPITGFHIGSKEAAAPTAVTIPASITTRPSGR